MEIPYLTLDNQNRPEGTSKGGAEMATQPNPPQSANCPKIGSNCHVLHRDALGEGRKILPTKTLTSLSSPPIIVAKHKKLKNEAGGNISVDFSLLFFGD